MDEDDLEDIWRDY